jgi:hypothetical protein
MCIKYIKDYIILVIVAQRGGVFHRFSVTFLWHPGYDFAITGGEIRFDKP